MGLSPSNQSVHGRRRIFLQGLSLCALIFFPACGLPVMALMFASEFNNDISDKEELWGEFKPGQVYETTMDLFIMDVKNYSYGPGLTIGKDDLPGGGPIGRGFYYTAEATFDDYRENPDVDPDILGVLNQGSRIRIEDLRVHGVPMANHLRFRYVRAEILTGEHEALSVTLSNMTRSRLDERAGVLIIGPVDYFLTLVEDEESPTDSNVQVE